MKVESYGFFIEHPEWRTTADTNHEEAVRNRRALIDRAARKDTFLAASPSHFSFPFVGRVTTKSDGGRWQPLPDPRSIMGNFSA